MSCDKVCSKCSTVMEKGYVAEHQYRAWGELRQLEFSMGEPRYNWLAMLKDAPSAYLLSAYRCPGCRAVEFYA